MRKILMDVLTHFFNDRIYSAFLMGFGLHYIASMAILRLSESEKNILHFCVCLFVF